MKGLMLALFCFCWWQRGLVRPSRRSEAEVEMMAR